MTSVKPDLAADEWYFIASSPVAESFEGIRLQLSTATTRLSLGPVRSAEFSSSRLLSGNVIKSIDGTDVEKMSFDNTKALLGKISKEGKDFKMVLLRFDIDRVIALHL